MGYRKKAFKRQHKCAGCGIRKNLTVHHLDLNHNNNIANNLQVLCEDCHARIHGIRIRNSRKNSTKQVGTRGKYHKGTKRSKRK